MRWKGAGCLPEVGRQVHMHKTSLITAQTSAHKHPAGQRHPVPTLQNYQQESSPAGQQGHHSGQACMWLWDLERMGTSPAGSGGGEAGGCLRHQGWAGPCSGAAESLGGFCPLQFISLLPCRASGWTVHATFCRQRLSQPRGIQGYREEPLASEGLLRPHRVLGRGFGTWIPGSTGPLPCLCSSWGRLPGTLAPSGPEGYP